MSLTLLPSGNQLEAATVLTMSSRVMKNGSWPTLIICYDDVTRSTNDVMQHVRPCGCVTIPVLLSCLQCCDLCSRVGLWVCLWSSWVRGGD